ncbi:MAG: very short patch repair endonuclease [Acidobacteriota bacterium]|nr:very short patch repair endonuclease [Acidobacteriota bacterium]
MTDNRTPQSRSALMSRIGPRNTAPEMIVRSLLHSMGYRYRLHRKDLPGKPDLVLVARRKVIFVHGCFWHAHGCRIGQPPKSRLDFWNEKLKKNVRRDEEQKTLLQAKGWSVLTVWQCETKNLKTLKQTLAAFLENNHCALAAGGTS